jgi:uncharacterized membrane protein
VIQPNPYQPASQPPFPATPAATQQNGPAKTGFILGLCAIVGWLLPIVGLPLTITGIVFSSMGLSRASQGQGGKTKAIWGLVLNIAFLCLTLINAIVGAIMAANRYSH